MKILITNLFALTLLFALPVFADAPEAYIIEDGPTGAETSDVTSSAPAAPEAIAVTKTEDGGVAYDPVSRKPPCSTSTCITPQSVANAGHAYVQDSPVKSYISLIETPEGEDAACQALTKTGMTVYRQTLPEDDFGGPGVFKQHDDGFCINQGCVYFSANDGGCELSSG